MLVLKDYQQRALDRLREFFADCVRLGDAEKAFRTVTRKSFGAEVPYLPVRALDGLPYVCLRIPTGGGKTLVACHAVEPTARELLHTDKPVVLWLVPSNAILDQTLRALKDRRHPYRMSLDSTMGAINVLDVPAALEVKRATLAQGTTIIVSTMQAFRVEDTLGRRVYGDSGELMDHFSDLPPEAMAGLEKFPNGTAIRSLANVLRVHRPIVIVDEAHNARTSLSFETLARFSPSCIIEFSATPDREKNPSNILYSVSARELKADAMIKMPIRLETRPDWKELLSDAVGCLGKLREFASKEQQETGEYIRPIMLLQAQPHRQGIETLSVENVLEILLKDHNVPREEIAIATGTTNELDGVENLPSPDCKLRYIITVQALREGWDCPFAYVLCSVAESHSATYVEQILGRIMRLPRAAWKNHSELNMAYAFAASDNWSKAANSLEDGLVRNGFERQDAKDLIVRAGGSQAEMPFTGPQAFMGTVTVTMPEAPEPAKLSAPTRAKVTFRLSEKEMSFKGAMTKPERDELKECFPTQEGKGCVEVAYRLSNGLPLRGDGDKPFQIPVLSLKIGNVFEQFEESHFLDHPWELLQQSALLAEAEFPKERPKAQLGEVSITDDGQIKSKYIENLHTQMTFLADDGSWRVADLVYWLDSNILHRDLAPQETGVFLTRIVQALIDQRGISLAQLVHDKYRLRDAAAAKIGKYRQSARHASYQAYLLPDCETPLVVDEQCCFTFDPRQYPAGPVYRGRYEFQKHFYEDIGAFDSDEEAECGQIIDQLDEVEAWVRNLSGHARHSFWLQTATDKFYPDFVCRLKDGRYLVVEYKGEGFYNDDAKEKQALGELWEKRSAGKCLFVMVVAGDYEAIRQKLRV